MKTNSKVCPEAFARMCSVKKVVLKISKNSQKNTCVRVSFFNKVATLLKKETLAQVFFCEFWEIFKNTFYRATLVAASVCQHNSEICENIDGISRVFNLNNTLHKNILLALCISESCIHLNFYFDTSFWCLSKNLLCMIFLWRSGIIPLTVNVPLT